MPDPLVTRLRSLCLPVHLAAWIVLSTCIHGSIFHRRERSSRPCWTHMFHVKQRVASTARYSSAPSYARHSRPCVERSAPGRGATLAVLIARIVTWPLDVSRETRGRGDPIIDRRHSERSVAARATQHSEITRPVRALPRGRPLSSGAECAPCGPGVPSEHHLRCSGAPPLRKTFHRHSGPRPSSLRDRRAGDGLHAGCFT